MDRILKHLIDGCIDGDKASQLDLYNRYSKILFNVCLRITGNPQDAEEAMQDAFLNVFVSLCSFNGSSFEAWLKRVAVNSAIDTIRRQKETWDELKEDCLLADVSDEDGNDEYVKLEIESIKNAMSLLAPGYRTILSLYLFEGYDMEEIADILQVRPVTVRSQYMRGKKKLLDIISKRNDRLKDFIKQNKASFDNTELPEEHLRRFMEKLERVDGKSNSNLEYANRDEITIRRRVLFRWMAFIAAASIAFLLYWKIP